MHQPLSTEQYEELKQNLTVLVNTCLAEFATMPSHAEEKGDKLKRKAVAFLGCIAMGLALQDSILLETSDRTSLMMVRPKDAS